MSKVILFLIAVLVVALALLAGMRPAGAQPEVPTPTPEGMWCGFDDAGNWVCFSGTNDLTPTATFVTPSAPPTPESTSTVEPTATPTPSAYSYLPLVRKDIVLGRGPDEPSY